MKQFFSNLIRFGFLFTFLTLLIPDSGFSQKNKKSSNNTTHASVSDSLFNGLKWRNIGPFRAGRSLAVSGHADQPLTYYFGATGGGVWKTIDGGNEWFPISDSIFKSSSVVYSTSEAPAPLSIFIIHSNMSLLDDSDLSNVAGITE